MSMEAVLYDGAGGKKQRPAKPAPGPDGIPGRPAAKPRRSLGGEAPGAGKDAVPDEP
jgi:hypothetical protein